MINFLIEYIYSLMYVIGLTFIISLVIPNVRKQNTVKLMISAIIYAIVVNIVTYSTADFASWFIIGNLICMATDFIYCGFITNQYKLSNLLVTILYYNIFSMCSSLLVTIAMLLKSSNYLYVALGNVRGLIVAIINLFSIFISYNIFKNKQFIFDHLSTLYLTLYTLTNITELTIILLLNTILSDINNILVMIAVILMSFLLILVNYFMISSSENFIEKGKLELLENSYSITKQYLEDLSHEQLELNKFKHDFSNHLNVLNGLVNNDSLEAKKYLTKLNENLKEIKQVVFSGNSIVDSIINFKVNLNPDINFETNLMVKKEINIPENKLSSLLFNLIDNAIAAARDTNDKTVTIKIISKNDMLLIEISNSANKEPNFITNKGKGHGNGMMIIKEIVSSLGGMINYKYNQNLVSFRIIISE